MGRIIARCACNDITVDTEHKSSFKIVVDFIDSSALHSEHESYKTIVDEVRPLTSEDMDKAIKLILSQDV